MNDAELLAAMRAVYQYATLEDHMLVDGRVRLRCRRCRVSPLPGCWGCVMLCDPCLDARLLERTDREALNPPARRRG